MAAASTIASFQQLPAVDGMMKSLLKLLYRNDEEDTDVRSAVVYVKSVLDGYINELEDDNRTCIEGDKDLFYSWVFLKVIMYRNQTTATGTGRDERNMGVEFIKCPGLEGGEVGKHDDVGKRKSQFSQHLEELQVVINQPNFTAASLAFTTLYVPICGHTSLKSRGRVRDGREHEKTASYYCPCAKEDNLFFQLRHNEVTDVKMVNKEKRYVFRCFTKAGYAQLVLNHFRRIHSKGGKPESVYHEKIQTYASATRSVAEGLEIFTEDGNIWMTGEDMLSIMILGGRRPPGDKDRILREAYENMMGEEMKKKDVGVLSKGQKVISEMNNSIKKRGRAENSYSTCRGKKCNVNNVSDSSKFNNNKCMEQVCVRKWTATERTEVKSDSDEEDHETTEAFVRFRTQLLLSQKRERKVREL